MLITRVSQLTGNKHTLDLPVTEEQMYRFWNGELIQNVFPHLVAAEREFILNGITAEEWTDMFGDGEDDDDDYDYNEE
jgi:hypothetical protein